MPAQPGSAAQDLLATHDALDAATWCLLVCVLSGNFCFFQVQLDLVGNPWMAK
jgi:hypothetical protein